MFLFLGWGEVEFVSLRWLWMIYFFSVLGWMTWYYYTYIYTVLDALEKKERKKANIYLSQVRGRVAASGHPARI